MAVCIKNPALKKRIYKLMDKYDNLAIKAYDKGKMAQGKKYEKKSDQLYAKNYNKMFEVVKKRRKK